MVILPGRCIAVVAIENFMEIEGNNTQAAVERPVVDLNLIAGRLEHLALELAFPCHVPLAPSVQERATKPIVSAKSGQDPPAWAASAQAWAASAQSGQDSSLLAASAKAWAELFGCVCKAWPTGKNGTEPAGCCSALRITSGSRYSAWGTTGGGYAGS